jgi:site-specific DNA recombinase
MNKMKDYAKKVKNQARKNSSKCVVYTRVSSKDQADNNGSLGTQMKYCMEFVEHNKLELVECFGGTYESAKSDDNRKEFQRMLKYVKDTKDISTIVVYSLDRFSRTGGQASSIITQLRSRGVEVRAVQQDFKTSDPSGVMMQEIMMVMAKADNEMRRDKSVTGMREKLKQGYWIGHTPKGYTNENRKSTADQQKFVINEEGELIKEAFEMRMIGHNYQTIYDRLSPKGFTTKSRHIGRLLANPFYAGYISHNLLEGEILKGKHIALVSEELFFAANNAKDNAKGKIKRANKKHEELPLKTFMKDEESGVPFTGYIARKVDIPYYKNRHGNKSVNINARKVNNLFKVMLSAFQIDESEKLVIEEMLMKAVKEKLKSSIKQEEKSRKTIKEFNEKKEALAEKFVEGDLDKETYRKLKDKYQSQIREAEAILQNSPLESSNLKGVVKKTVDICLQFPGLWEKASFDNKRILQELVFPEGILLNKKNRTVRTERINELLFSIAQYTSDIEENKKGENDFEIIFPHSVPGVGIEPTRSCDHWILNPARLPIPPPGRGLFGAANLQLQYILKHINWKFAMGCL